MEVRSERRRERPCTMLVGGLVAFLTLYLLVMSGCGTTAPDQPLSAGVGTPLVQGSPVASPSSGIAPIELIQSQTNLSAYPGGYMTMAISTSPFAVSSFAVNYGLGAPSKAPGVVPRTTDAKGVANWRWQVELGARTGEWPLTISAILPDGSRTIKQVNVTVAFAPVNVVGSQSTLGAYPKGSMTLTIATAPRVSCTLQLNFGPGVPGRTLRRRADSNGTAVLTWRVDSQATPGRWPLILSVGLLDGESASSSLSITIL
jgi:hypothetical protein